MVGLPGDEVRIVGHVLTVNGVALKGCGRRIARDSTGRAVPRRRWGGGVIPAGDLFVCGLARRSWDSRYFGPVRRPRAIAVAWPLWTRDWGWGELNGWRKAYAEKGEPR
uniref:Conjugal transfer protein n=1 Tax=mine drainage metagenome TaxID=410659 RepID=E6QPB4_9ZZZZ